jgi:hypothetical protein
MMLPFCASLNYIRIRVKFLCMHDDEYFEYLLGDPNYLSANMFIMKRIRRCEIGLNADQDAIRTYNKMHVRYIV